MPTISTPQDYFRRQPTKNEQLMYRLIDAVRNLEMQLMNLQNNYVALKNVSKVSDEQIETELKAMNEAAQKALEIPQETKEAVASFAPAAEVKA